MRKIAKFLLLRPILWIIENFSSDPDRKRIFSSLTKLRDSIEHTGGSKGFTIPSSMMDRFIIFSDQHRGRKNGADDFVEAEPNYLSALQYYNSQGFHLISLGDSEELWENTLVQVMRHNKLSFAAEKKFIDRKAFTKIFGNHDLDWDIDPLAPTYLKEIYGSPVSVLEGLMLQIPVGNEQLNILCTHGHQGDLQSDGNWFSKFFVSKIWAPLQAYLQIYPNTPAYDQNLKTLHNRIMYEWSAQQQNLILITGHTHQPVFASLTHIEHLDKQRRKALYDHNKEWAEALDLEIQWRSKEDAEAREDYSHMKPTYFNSGCCCFSDGDITGIEIADGFIRLIKWKSVEGVSQRIVLEERSLEKLIGEL